MTVASARSRSSSFGWLARRLPAWGDPPGAATASWQLWQRSRCAWSSQYVQALDAPRRKNCVVMHRGATRTLVASMDSVLQVTVATIYVHVRADGRVMPVHSRQDAMANRVEPTGGAMRQAPTFAASVTVVSAGQSASMPRNVTNVISTSATHGARSSPAGVHTGIFPRVVMATPKQGSGPAVFIDSLARRVMDCQPAIRAKTTVAAQAQDG
jgi:hypothetical protein